MKDVIPKIGSPMGVFQVTHGSLCLLFNPEGPISVQRDGIEIATIFQTGSVQQPEAGEAIEGPISVIGQFEADAAPGCSLMASSGQASSYPLPTWTHQM